MTLPAFATVEQLEIRLGQSIEGVLIPQAEWLLEFASDRIRARTGRTWTDENDDLVDVPGLVTKITVEMVYRAVSNPEGVTQDTAGPFTLSFGPEAAQRLYIAKQEMDDLSSLSGRSGLRTISTTRGSVEMPSESWL